MRTSGPILPDPSVEKVVAWPLEMVGCIDIVDCGEMDENGRVDLAHANFQFKDRSFGPGFTIHRHVLDEAELSIFDFSEKRTFRVWIEPMPGAFVAVGGSSGLKKIQAYSAVRIERIQ
jgi:hypothetical protein